MLREVSLSEMLKSIAELLSPAAWIGVAVGVAALAGAVLLWRILRRRKVRGLAAPTDLTIPLDSLSQLGPPEAGPALEFYYIPVRLAAVILAPVGRVRGLPPPSQLQEVFDAILPNLNRIVQAQQPLVRRWPAQVSVRGFANLLFTHVRLPGEGGKGTPWSAAAGIVKLHGQPLMAGLILRAESSNSLGQIVIDREENWLGCLRVKPGGQ
jgi:hypothetical protein